MTKRTQQGFTLLEILIALFIFAILSVITVMGLRSVIKTYKDIDSRQVKIQRLILVTTLLRRDISQIINRTSINNKGQEIPAIRSLQDGLTFVRTGAFNPDGLFRHSDLLQVSYTQQGRHLVRVTNSADPGSYGQLVQLTLLKNIKQFDVKYLQANGRFSNEWPLPESNQNLTPEPLPRAIKVTIIFQSNARLNLFVPLESRGIYATTN